MTVYVDKFILTNFLLNFFILHITKSVLKSECENLRLVLCTEDRILHDFALTGEEQTFTVDASAGSVFFKVAGESAEFSLDYVID